MILRYLVYMYREGKEYMFKHNQSVVNSYIMPIAKLYKRHNAL